MDPEFIARLERQARAKHGLLPLDDDQDISIQPAPKPQPNPKGQQDLILQQTGEPPQEDHQQQQQQQQDEHADKDDKDGDRELDEDAHDDEEDDESDDDDDEELRRIGEVTEEYDDQNQLLIQSPHQEHINDESDQPQPLPPNDEAEEDEDDGTTDSEEEFRPKKPDPLPTIRLQLALPTQLPLTTVRKSVSLLAKQAGYVLPADSAITFGGSPLPEPEPESHPDIPPPPKRRRRKRIQERDEGYDKDDPFVDDSEAFIMEPKFYYAPARDGFFVASGRLELKSDLKDTSNTRKPSSKGSKRPSSALTPDSSKPKKRTALTTLAELPPAGTKPASQSNSQPSKPAPSSLKPNSSDPNHPIIQPSNHLSSTSNPTNPSTSDSPKPTNIEGQAVKTQASPSNGKSSQIVPSRPPPPTTASKAQQPLSGSPLNPISLLDDENRSNQAQASSSKSHLPPPSPPPPRRDDTNPSIASAPGPPSQTNLFPRPVYLKSRSLPERKTAGPLPPILEEALSDLKVQIEAASPFIPKKFPPQLKPATLAVAQMALDLNEYDECFFIRLASLFPYNTFTIKKFVKREILPQRKLYYEGAINERIAKLKQMIIEGMPNARAEYQEASLNYQSILKDFESKQQQRSMTNNTTTSSSSRHIAEESTTSSNTITPSLPTNASTILTHNLDNNPLDPFNQTSFDTTSQTNEKTPKPPQKYFKITKPMGELLYELIKLEDELCETIKDTQKIVDKNVTLKDTSNRRQFYQRLAKLWPDEFMTTSKLSREVSNMKRKLEVPAAIEPSNLITLH